MRQIWIALGEGARGAPQLRMRIGFLVIAIVLSVFGGRLLQLQGVDPNKYALMAAKESSRRIVLPATRGSILDRNGSELASSVPASMVIADPALTRPKAAKMARFLALRLDVDYFATLDRLRAPGRRFEYIARRVPSSLAEEVLEEAEGKKFKGLTLLDDSLRTYPGHDIAANLVGFVGTEKAWAGLEFNFDEMLAGRDGVASYHVGKEGAQIPLGSLTIRPAQNGETLRTTLDMDLQFYSQRVLRETVENAGGDSGTIVVLDSRTGELLANADYPTFDANEPLEADNADLGARSVSDVYEPGSVQKVLTAAALVDDGRVTANTKLVVPGSLTRQDRVINDWFPHGTLYLTMAGVMAQSSNIGTVLAADGMSSRELRGYLSEFGLGEETRIGLSGESAGLLPQGDNLTSQTKDRMVFGQSLSVTAVQMAAAVNTVANGGVYVSPSLIQGRATTDDGVEVGTDHAVTRRVVSEKAARQTTLMMERVLDPEDGVAPGAAVSGYRVAGKTGTAQRVGEECGCYDGSTTVSFAGFAPADDPRFTIYVVVHNPRNGGGGGSVAGPAFAKVMGYALRRYRVPPTETTPSQLPVWWNE
jgi:cell division protein FtsI (penicillin-binding protein 3)